MTETTETEQRMKGVIKWYDPRRRYGFILPFDGTKDFFFHASSIEGDYEPQDNDGVTFKPGLSPKGKEAREVRKES